MKSVYNNKVGRATNRDDAPAWKKRAAGKKSRARLAQQVAEQRCNITTALVGLLLVDAVIHPVAAARPVEQGLGARCAQLRAIPGSGGKKVMDDGAHFSPRFWNDNSTIQATNNCYNYATNHASNAFAAPGQLRGGDIAWPTSTCAQLSRAVKYDGLFETACATDCPADHTKVAATVATQGKHTLHWYRQHVSGRWSHKMGSLPATDKDAHGLPIFNLQAANRDYSNLYAVNYDSLCGCYCSPCIPLTTL